VLQGGEQLPSSPNSFPEIGQELAALTSTTHNHKQPNLRRKRRMERIKNFFSDDAGNATEYGLIIALISVAIILGATTLGEGLKDIFNKVGGQLSTQAGKIT
jgi:pilus assembly protein Flp/PilA